LQFQGRFAVADQRHPLRHEFARERR
jgi:hypothetical protein